MKYLNINLIRIGIVFFLFLIFYPYLVYDFGFHNDFEIWAYDNKNCCSGFPETSHLITIGRFLQAYLQNIYLYFFHDLSDLAFGRGVGIFVGSICAILLSHICYSNNMNKFASVIFALTVFMLPPAQINFGWITNFIPGIFNALVVLISILIFPTLDKIRKKSFIYILSIIMSFVILLCSLFIYPPTAGFFLLPIMIRVLFSKYDEIKNIKDIFYTLGFFFFTCVTYFIIHKIYIEFFGQKLPETSLYRFDISSNLFTNLYEFIFEILPVMLNLSIPAPTSFITFSYLVIVIFFLRSKINRDLLSNNLKIILIVLLIAVFLASNAPGLLASGSPPSFYRSWHPGISMCLLFFIWAIHLSESKQLINICLIVILFTSALFSYNSSSYLSRTLSEQFNYSKLQIKQQLTKNTSRFVIIEKRPENKILGIERWGELGFVHVLSRGHGIYILNKFFNNKIHREIENIVVFQGNNKIILEKSLIFEREDLIKFIKKDNVSVLTDNRLDTFYENKRNFIKLNLESLYSQNVYCYKLFADIFEPDRMPLNWNLYGSPDGKKWELLDKQNLSDSWDKGEAKLFSINSSKVFKYFRFEFKNFKKISRLSELRFFNKQESCQDKEIILSKANINLYNSLSLNKTNNQNIEVIGLSNTNALSDNPFRLQRALDNIYYTFWETLGFFPIIVDFSMNKKLSLKCYSISSGDDKANHRMPVKWSLLGSNDKISWKVIDARTNERNWKNSSTRIYKIKGSESYKYYRLKFFEVDGGKFFRIYELGLSRSNNCINFFP